MTENMLVLEDVTKVAYNLFKNVKAFDINFIIITKDTQGRYHINPRFLQPCYGEMTKYEDPHGEQGWCNKYRPQDLYFPFPRYQKPVKVIASFSFDEYTKEGLKSVNLLESCWKAGFNNPHIRYGFDDVGVLPSEMYFVETMCQGICATTLVHFFRQLRHYWDSNLPRMLESYKPFEVFDYRDIVGSYDQTCLYYRGGQEDMFQEKHSKEEMCFHD
jgi:hypothetical protein